MPKRLLSLLLALVLLLTAGGAAETVPVRRGRVALEGAGMNAALSAALTRDEDGCLRGEFDLEALDWAVKGAFLQLGAALTLGAEDMEAATITPAAAAEMLDLPQGAAYAPAIIALSALAVAVPYAQSGDLAADLAVGREILAREKARAARLADEQGLITVDEEGKAQLQADGPALRALIGAALDALCADEEALAALDALRIWDYVGAAPGAAALIARFRGWLENVWPGEEVCRLLLILSGEAVRAEADAGEAGVLSMAYHPLSGLRLSGNWKEGGRERLGISLKGSATGIDLRLALAAGEDCAATLDVSLGARTVLRVELNSARYGSCAARFTVNARSAECHCDFTAPDGAGWSADIRYNMVRGELDCRLTGKDGALKLAASRTRLVLEGQRDADFLSLSLIEKRGVWRISTSAAWDGAQVSGSGTFKTAGGALSYSAALSDGAGNAASLTAAGRDGHLTLALTEKETLTALNADWDRGKGAFLVSADAAVGGEGQELMRLEGVPGPDGAARAYSLSARLNEAAGTGFSGEWTLDARGTEGVLYGEMRLSSTDGTPGTGANAEEIRASVVCETETTTGPAPAHADGRTLSGAELWRLLAAVMAVRHGNV